LLTAFCLSALTVLWVVFGTRPAKMLFRHFHVHNREHTSEDEAVWEELQNLDEWVSYGAVDGFKHDRLKLYMVDHWKRGPEIFLSGSAEFGPLYTNNDEHVWKLWSDLNQREATLAAKTKFDHYRKSVLGVTPIIRDMTPAEIAKKMEEKLKEQELDAALACHMHDKYISPRPVREMIYDHHRETVVYTKTHSTGAL